MKKILITGGSGLIGTHLARRLQEKGYQVALLSRSPDPGHAFPVYTWNPDTGELDDRALDHADFIIHLAGVNIGGKRWTRARKKLILDSRVKSGELLLHAIKQRKLKPRAFISASAIGYYGAVSSDALFDEAAPAYPDFLGQTCETWEGVADGFEDYGIRSVKIRAGIVLSKHGGALPKLSLPIRFGLGAPLGNGLQYMPWIHIEDLCGIFIHTLEHSQLAGAFNAVAPEHLTNRELTLKIARELKRALWLPGIPAGVLRFLFGEMSLMLLRGSRISSEKIRAAGYHFQFPDAASALRSLYTKEQ